MTEQNHICKEFAEKVLPTLYGTASDAYKRGSIIYGSFILTFFIVGFLLFCLFKHKYVRLQPRSTLIIFIAMLSGLSLQGVNILYAEGYGRHQVPCHLRIWAYHFPLVFMGPGLVGTLLMYIYRLRMERDRFNKALAPAPNPQSKRKLMDIVYEKSQRFLKGGKSEASAGSDGLSFCSQLIDFLNVLKYSKDGRIGVQTRIARAPTVDEEAGSRVDPMSDEDASSGTDNDSLTTATAALFSLNDSADKNYTKSFRQKFMESIGYPLSIVIMLGFHIPIIVALRIELDPIYKANCTGCDLSYVDYVLMFVNVGSYVVVMFLAAYAMRNESDPLGILEEVKSVIALSSIVFVCYILLITDPGNLNKNYVFSWQFLYAFAHCGAFYMLTYHQLFTAMYQERVKFKKSSKAQAQSMLIVPTEKGGGVPPPLESLSPSDLDVDRILVEPKSRNALLEYAVDELSSENLVFLFKVKAWRSQYERESPDKITRVAVNIFKEYISRDSKSPINIPNSVYLETEKHMLPFLASSSSLSSASSTSSSGVSPASSAVAKMRKPPLGIFQNCEKECMLILETDTLPRFIHSEIFKKRIVEDGLLRKILKR